MPLFRALPIHAKSSQSAGSSFFAVALQNNGPRYRLERAQRDLKVAYPPRSFLLLRRGRQTVSVTGRECCGAAWENDDILVGLQGGNCCYTNGGRLGGKTAQMHLTGLARPRCGRPACPIRRVSAGR